MKIIYQCEVCGANHASEKLAEICEAQSYTPPLPTGTRVLYKKSVHRTGRERLHSDHTHSYILSRRASDNNEVGLGHNWSKEFTHERKFVVITKEPKKVLVHHSN